MYWVYILECSDKSLYTGITTDVARRFKQHQAGIGGHYTSSRQVVRVAYSESHPDRSSALKREAEIKRWPRAQKLTLLSCDTVPMENKHKAAGKEAMLIKKQKVMRVKQKKKKGK